MSDYTYSMITGDKLTLPVAEALSRVFSSSYGRWSALAPSPLRPGERIRMSSAMYMRDYAKRDIRFAMCRRNGELVGQAIFVERDTSRGRVALVVQLVVLESHRHRGIATMMLHSIFGFSDYYAWAVVTSSPCTIEALESATFRRGEPRRISQDKEMLNRELLSSVPFLAKAAWNIDETMSVLNTSFWTDRSNVLEGRTHVKERYGKLPEGCEWLAVVFRDQEPSNMRYIDMSGKLPMCRRTENAQVRYSAAYPTGRELGEKRSSLPWGRPHCITRNYDFSALAAVHNEETSLDPIRKRTFHEGQSIDRSVRDRVKTSPGYFPAIAEVPSLLIDWLKGLVSGRDGVPPPSALAGSEHRLRRIPPQSAVLSRPS